jgi:hypothetical protein
MASAAHQSRPFERLASRDRLAAAWDHVRRSAEGSASPAIRAEAQRFAASADRNLAAIAADLQADRFRFAPALGVAKPRAGKRPRPIVVAPLSSRVVTRALLEVLLGIPEVASLCLSATTSFGGLPGRGVGDAIAAAIAAVRGGAAFHLRSDIAEFFRAIPRDRAVAALAQAAGDERLARLVEQATATEIENLSDLGEDAALFPGAGRGVAQGNALSTLLGNVLLRDFDAAMNGRGIVCLRYVDDVLLLGPRAAHVKKAFASATRLLADLGLRAYDPDREPEKASSGPTAAGITWLGCEIAGGVARPSAANRERLLARVDRLLASAGPGGLAGALAGVDGAVRAFRGAYAFCECPEVFAALDARIDRRVAHAFRRGRAKLLGPRPEPAARSA